MISPEKLCTVEKVSQISFFLIKRYFYVTLEDHNFMDIPPFVFRSKFAYAQLKNQPFIYEYIIKFELSIVGKFMKLPFVHSIWCTIFLVQRILCTEQIGVKFLIKLNFIPYQCFV